MVIHEMMKKYRLTLDEYLGELWMLTQDSLSVEEMEQRRKYINSKANPEHVKLYSGKEIVKVGPHKLTTV